MPAGIPGRVTAMCAHTDSAFNLSALIIRLYCQFFYARAIWMSKIDSLYLKCQDKLVKNNSGVKFVYVLMVNAGILLCVLQNLIYQ